MIKRLYLVASLLVFIQSSYGQKISTCQDSIETYFSEIKVETNKHQQIWSTDLYGPILLVNPKTRQLFANLLDNAGILKQVGEFYYGILPNEIKRV